jgi:cbb3-type cytochrome oxidase maturation protein
MEVIYTLIPGMVLLGLIFVGVLWWAVKRGQYEDFEGDAHRILLDDDLEAPRKPKAAVTQKKTDPNWPDADDE